MANRQKRLERQLTKQQAELQFKQNLQQHKKIKSEGIFPVFEQWRNLQFNWEYLPESIKKIHTCPHYYILEPFTELYKYKLYKNIQVEIENLMQDERLEHLSLNFFGGFIQYFRTYKKSVRLVSTWKVPKSKKEAVLFKSLFLHLFIKYPIPKCAEREISIYSTTSLQSYFHSILFDLIFYGKGIHQTIINGFKLNGKANFYFHKAPQKYDLYKAIWWAKILSMGVSEKIAHVMLGSIQPDLYNEWSDVFEEYIFFIKKYNLQKVKQIKDILNFLMYQTEYKYYQAKLGENVLNIEPIFENYSLKGRTVESVQRHINEWKQHIESMKENGFKGDFHKPKVKPFRIEKEKKIFIIKRLKNFTELAEEGRAMKHCVASYLEECIKKESSIWSLRQIDASGKHKRLATIEIQTPDKEKSFNIGQLQAKCNSKPTDIAMRLIKHWGRREGFVDIDKLEY